MAVIDTSMDFPQSCAACPRRSNCGYGLVNGWIEDKRDDNCPLKSIDEMIAEIEQTFTPQYCATTNSVIKNRIVSIIHEYCDKGE